MTSLPAEPEPAEPEAPKKVPGWRQPWERWRILMLCGSLVLLGLAFSQFGGRERLPEWATVAIYAVGYGLLGYGFFLAMQTRKKRVLERAEADKKKKKKVSPRDLG
jgi:hypothetical protein